MCADEGEGASGSRQKRNGMVRRDPGPPASARKHWVRAQRETGRAVASEAGFFLGPGGGGGGRSNHTTDGGCPSPLGSYQALKRSLPEDGVSEEVREGDLRGRDQERVLPVHLVPHLWMGDVGEGGCDWVAVWLGCAWLWVGFGMGVRDGRQVCGGGHTGTCECVRVGMSASTQHTLMFMIRQISK